MKQLAVLGAGSWGTALSIALARRFETVRIWARSAERAACMQTSRVNAEYLPEYRLPENVTVLNDLASTVHRAGVLLLAVPSPYMRSVLAAAAPHVAPVAHVVSATKGIETGTLARMSQIATECLDEVLHAPVAVLSGPTFAKEIAAGEPAAVVVACIDSEIARSIQEAFATEALRFYASTDVIGVEIGAALKNVIAIGAGVCDGLGLGSNTRAALITRGLAEITRLAVTLGGQARTLSGLAGLGDLVLTATGGLSRNRHVGLELGRGRALAEILSDMKEVAEGVTTCRSARELGLRHAVELPIVNQVYSILYAGTTPRAAIRGLMERPLGEE